MTLEQVNVQELQRLNDAITITMDAMRRVAPQLAYLGLQYTQPWTPSPFAVAQQPFGFGIQAQSPFGNIGLQSVLGQHVLGQNPLAQLALQSLYGQQVPQVPYVGQQIDPITAAYLHEQVLRSILGQHMGIGTQISATQPQFRVPQIVPQMAPWQVSNSYGSPFLNLQQRPF